MARFGAISYSWRDVSQSRNRPLILLVDDSREMMAILRKVCAMQQYEALEAGTGRAALELAMSEKPDLILLDWGLPDISGIEVCQELRRSGVFVPILMLTGRGDDRDVVTGLQMGVDEYLVKPVRVPVLAARLAANLRRASAGTEGVNTATLSLLDRISIFLNHPPGALRLLAKKAFAAKVRTGAVVLTKGALNHSLFLIQSGSFEVTIERSPGNKLAVALLGESDFFGAVSVLTGEPATAWVTAREDSTLVKISRDDLLAALVPGSEARAHLESTAQQRRELLRSVHDRIATTGDGARLLSLYSPKGGVGKTTLALNLAATLARHHPGQVLLIDCSLPYNHAALLAQLTPSTSLARLAENLGIGFNERLLSAVVHHAGGFQLLSTALAPEEADLITPALVSRALTVLKPRFRYIICDLGVVLSEIALLVLEQSRDVFVIATPELLIVKDLIKVYGILHDVLRLASGHVHLVVNHRESSGAVGRQEIEKLLGVEIAVEIRNDGHRPEQAALKGEILAVSASKSPIAVAATGLARLID